MTASNQLLCFLAWPHEETARKGVGGGVFASLAPGQRANAWDQERRTR